MQNKTDTAISNRNSNDSILIGQCALSFQINFLLVHNRLRGLDKMQYTSDIVIVILASFVIGMRTLILSLNEEDDARYRLVIFSSSV